MVEKTAADFAYFALSRRAFKAVSSNEKFVHETQFVHEIDWNENGKPLDEANKLKSKVTSGATFESMIESLVSVRSASHTRNKVHALDHSGEFDWNKDKSFEELGTTNTSMDAQATVEPCISLGGTISRMGVVPKLGRNNAGRSENNIVEQEN